MIDVFLTTIYPVKLRDILAPSVVGRSRVPVRVVAATPLKDPPEIDGVLWIHHEGSVMQCQEAALKSCTAPYVVHAVDDLSYDPGCLDALKEALDISPRTIASPQYWHYGALEERAHHPGLFIGCEGTAPVCPMNGMYRLEEIRPLLPYDQQFLDDYGFSDLTLRLMKLGWKVVTLPTLRVHDTGKTEGDSLWITRGQHDWERLKRKWCPGNIVDPELTRILS